MNYWITIIGLVLGNYGYQAAGGMDWMVAFERSFFQATAIGTLALFNWMDSRKEGQK